MSRSTRNINLNAGTGRSASRSFGSVVDTFVAPARGKSGWHSLSKALGVAGDVVGRQEEIARQQKAAADERRGQIEGISLSMAHDPALIKAGEMFPQESTAFMAGLRQSQSQAWAYEQMRRWNSEWDASPNKDSNDPEAFKGFMQTKISEFRRSVGDDQYALAGALPVLQQGINNMSTQHTAYTSDRVKSDELTAMRDVTLGIMETHDWDQDPTGSALVQSLALQADMRVAKGLDGSSVNQKLVDDVLSFSDAMNDTRYLAALAKAHDDGTYRLSASQMKQVDDALLNIEAEEDAIERSTAAALKKQKDDMKASALQNYHTALLEDPLAMPDKGLPQDVYKSALALREAINKALRVSDPDAEAAALKTLNAALYHPDFRQLPYHEKMEMVLPLLNDPNVPASASLIQNTMRLIGAEHDPASPLSNATITKLRGNAVTAMKTMGGGVSVFGNDNQLAVALQSNYDNLMLGYDLEGKTPLEVRDIHDQVLYRSMMDLLENQDTRLDLLDSLENNPALVRQFGLTDYFAEFYEQDAVAKAADELAAATAAD